MSREPGERGFCSRTSSASELSGHRRFNGDVGEGAGTAQVLFAKSGRTAGSRACGQANDPAEARSSESGVESGKAGGTFGQCDRARVGAVGRILDESLQALDQPLDELLCVGHQLLPFREHFVGAGGRVDLEAILRRISEKKILGLTEKSLLDPAVFQDIESGLAQESITHRSGEMLEQMGVAEMGKMDVILALEPFVDGQQRQIRAVELKVDHYDGKQVIETRATGVAKRGASHVDHSGER